MTMETMPTIADASARPQPPHDPSEALAEIEGARTPQVESDAELV